MKTHYRTFNIRDEDLTPGDDMGMMREVLRRRFARLLKEEAGANDSIFRDASGASPDAPRVEAAISLNPHAEEPAQQASRSMRASAQDPDAFPSRPDLVLIDGGRGQFEAARTIFAELGVTGRSAGGYRQGRRPQCRP